MAKINAEAYSIPSDFLQAYILRIALSFINISIRLGEVFWIYQLEYSESNKIFIWLHAGACIVWKGGEAVSAAQLNRGDRGIAI